MEKLRDIVRFLLISPENIILLSIFVSLHWLSSYFVEIGNNLKTYSDVWKWMPGIPVFYVTLSYRLFWKVLTPLGNTPTKVLSQWPKYWKLMYRSYASLIICGMAAIGSIIIWFFSNKISECNLGVIFIISVTVPVASILCQLSAAITVRKLLDRYT